MRVALPPPQFRWAPDLPRRAIRSTPETTMTHGRETVESSLPSLCELGKIDGRRARDSPGTLSALFAIATAQHRRALYHLTSQTVVRSVR